MPCAQKKSRDFSQKSRRIMVLEATKRSEGSFECFFQPWGSWHLGQWAATAWEGTGDKVPQEKPDFSKTKMYVIFYAMDEDVRLFVHHRNVWVRGEGEGLSDWARKGEASEQCKRDDWEGLCLGSDHGWSKCVVWEIKLPAKFTKEWVPAESWGMVNWCSFECLVIFWLDARQCAFYLEGARYFFFLQLFWALYLDTIKFLRNGLILLDLAFTTF